MGAGIVFGDGSHVGAHQRRLQCGTFAVPLNGKPMAPKSPHAVHPWRLVSFNKIFAYRGGQIAVVCDRQFEDGKLAVGEMHATGLVMVLAPELLAEIRHTRFALDKFLQSSQTHEPQLRARVEAMSVLIARSEA